MPHASLLITAALLPAMLLPAQEPLPKSQPEKAPFAPTENYAAQEIEG